MRSGRDGGPRGPAVDWRLRTNNTVRSFLRRLERLTIGAERPVNKAAGSARLNPLYHTGTIAFFLFIVVVVTGVYLTMFFQYGFEASYIAVERLEANLVGRLVRAVHRYASIALVVTSLLHGWRTFVQDRFRGARWLAWVSGIWMMALIWFIGVTGYWVIWDERAQGLNEILIRAIGGTTVGLDFLLDGLVTPAAGSGWPFLLLLLLTHIFLSLVVGLFFWYHVKRLNHAKLWPPRFWMSLIGGTIVIVSLLWPAGMLPPLDTSAVPGTFPLDPFYLFLFPAGLRLPPFPLWAGFLLVGIALSAIPWVRGRKPLEPVAVDPDRCTGCTLCVVDCPYGALEMVPREDDAAYRQIARLVPNRCISCGICIGSCSDDALSLDGLPIDELSAEVVRLAATGQGPTIVFTCERHALHGAADRFGEHAVTDVHVIPVPCIGMVHPRRATEALDAGAGDVQFVGCPPADCANRDGNTWMQERIDRVRVPRLKRAYVDAPIRTDWVAPTDFAAALDEPGAHSVADPKPAPPWKELVPIGAVVLLVSLASIALTYLPFTPWGAEDAIVSIALHHQGGAPFAGLGGEIALEDGAQSRLVVTLDGTTIHDEEYPLVGVDGVEASIALERLTIEPGTHALLIEVFDRVDRTFATVLFDDTIALGGGEILDLSFIDDEVIDPADAGREIFFESSLGQNAGCHVCHSVEPNTVVVGPSLAGVATRAKTRVPGLTDEEYLRQSIVDPDAFVVEDFRPGLMLQDFAETLTEREIDDLVAYLMTLK